MPSSLSVFVFVAVLSIVDCLKHNFIVKQDARTLIAPIGKPYGFFKDGCFGFDVFDFNLEIGHKHKKNTHPSMSDEKKKLLKGMNAGFLLKRFSSESAFAKYEEEFLSNSSHCIFDHFIEKDKEPLFGGEDDDQGEFATVGDVDAAATDGIFLPIHWANSTWQKSSASIMYKFKQGESGLYFLMYQVCTSVKAEIRSTFEVDFHYKNKDPLGGYSYLDAGEYPLPVMFFYFFGSYLVCTIIWIMNIRSIRQGKEGMCLTKPGERPVIFPIHQLMSVLLILKTATVFFESVRYHYIRLTGHAQFWTAVYYCLSFLKGMFLFTVILLIGSGWSFLKPFLSDGEKKIIFVVLVMQVIDNIALVVLSTETEGESVYDDWSAILHMVDIMCCCAVLVPIVWSVNSLERTLENKEANAETPPPPQSDEEAETMTIATSPETVTAHEEQDKSRTLSKLKLFRQFYLLVVVYIYFTRIAVYLFATILDYRHTWVRHCVTELATLVFYVVMGLSFRPMGENPYLAVTNQEDQAPEVEMVEDMGGSKKK